MLGGGDSTVGHPLSFPPVLGRSTFGRHQRFTGAIREYALFTTAETPGRSDLAAAKPRGLVLT